jgi:hypothetical protein
MNRTMYKTIINEQKNVYFKANLADKTEIISSICQVTGMRRKSAIRALAREYKRLNWKSPPRLGRPKYYTAETEAALAFIWEQYDYPTAERLHPEVTEAVRIFIRDHMWSYNPTATEQLTSMSLGAMKVRTVSFAKKRGLLRGIGTTRSGELLKSVPVFFGSWEHKGPGHGQVDTVAQLNKSERATTASLNTIQTRLPFRLAGIHPDSGSEFINLVGINWCQDNRIDLSRSRPSKKNDNCFVEQRNLVVVRKYVGYERYDCIEAVDAMNNLYETLRLYLNFFQPTFKLQGKEKRVKATDGKQAAKPYKRVYDQPKTPYSRVLTRKDIDQATKDKLTKQYESLNPKILRDTIRILTIKLERTQRELGYHY